MGHRKPGSFSEFLSMQVTSSHLYHHTFISSPWSLCPTRDLVGLRRPVTSIQSLNLRRVLLASP